MARWRQGPGVVLPGMGRCCRHHSLWRFGSGSLGNTRGRPVVWNVEPGRRGGSGRRPYGTNERNGGDPRENQGIGCSVDEPGRPRVRLPPLRRRDLRREPQESRKGGPTRLLENSTVCEKPVLHDPVNGSGTAGTSPRCTTVATVLGTSGRITDEPATASGWSLVSSILSELARRGW